MVNIAFLKKSRFTGGKGKMRYYLCCEDGKLKATVYPGPYCVELTPVEQMKSEFFEFNLQGLDAAVVWLNEQYREYK